MKSKTLLSSLLLILSTASAPADLFSDWDKDRNGKLTRDELPEPLQRNFGAVDTNRDGFISREEDRALRQRNRATQQAKTTPVAVKATLDIPYADTDNRAQRLDLFLPKTPAGNKPLPVIVFIHGGAWQAGSKAGGRGHLMPYVASGRYAGASVEYRLSQETRWPAQIHDCKAAIRWLKGHAKEFNLNPEKIAVWGTSAGGHLVAMLGVSGEDQILEGKLGKFLDQSSRVTCVADYFGPTNLLTMGDFPSTMQHNDANSPESKLIGGAIQEHKDAARNASPLFYITDDDAPVFIAHGTTDPLVPYNQTETFAAALKKAGVPVYSQTIRDGGHGGFEGPKLNARLKTFFDLYLLGIGDPTGIETDALKVRE
ncbi:MAG: alpha/beta hydrolase fold domain-containing protein [Akkermansiaceae bacterium]|nr:alpha/beta hydrolase fold domain-containing protein [Akkermansiaceae bacterium]